MEGILQRDDLVGPALVFVAPFARKLDRTFIGFGAAIGEEHFLETAVPDDLLREAHGRLVVESRARRDQLAGLLHQRIRYDSRAVAQAIHRPALHEIEVALAFVIPKPGALAADENERRPGRDVHQRLRGKISEFHDSILGLIQPENQKAAEFCGLVVTSGSSMVTVVGRMDAPRGLRNGVGTRRTGVSCHALWVASDPAVKPRYAAGERVRQKVSAESG